MLNASVGMQRVRERLRPTTVRRAAPPASLQRLTNKTAHRLSAWISSSVQAATALGSRLPASGRRVSRPRWGSRTRSVGVGPRSLGAQPRSGWAHRRAPAAHRIPRARLSRAAFAARLRGGLGSEGILPIAVSVIVLFASITSGGPGRLPNAPIGGPSGSGPESRLAIAGFTGELPELGGPLEGAAPNDGPSDAVVEGDRSPEDIQRMLDALGPEARALQEEPVGDASSLAPIIDGPFLEDGTLLKPVAVDTTVADGSGLVREYRVRSGDTLVGIAARFDVNMLTIWWANRLSSKDDLDVGQVLRIPTVDGLVVTVREGETLESIAARSHVKADAIYELNGLSDRNLVMGQTLLIPGARGAKIRIQRPTPRTSPTRQRPAQTRPPTRYEGGAFTWPVSGGDNYISQYFHYGHYAIDIAADYGSRVRAAASGTVVFAGYRSNGGGFQVWVAHGSGLYTTYNHMAGVSVGRGQGVDRGQQVGRVGCSGNCSGPHLHFETWRGYPWSGGHRVNPLIFY